MPTTAEPVRPAGRGRRLVKRTLVALAVLLVAGGAVTYFGLNRLVKRTVEQQTTRSLNLTTTVDAAALTVFGGRLHLDGFRIASPAGFSAEPVLDLPGGDMDFGYANLRRDPVRIHAVTFTRPRLLVENVNGRLNIRHLLAGLPPSAAKPLRLVIDEARVVDPVVVLRPGRADLPAEITVPVASFTLRDLGTATTGPDGRAGARVSEVIKELVAALAARAGESEALPPELRALLRDPVGAFVAQVGEEARRTIVGAIPAGVGRLLGGFVGSPASRAVTTRPAGPTSKPATNRAGGLFGGLLRGEVGPATQPVSHQ